MGFDPERFLFGTMHTSEFLIGIFPVIAWFGIALIISAVVTLVRCVRKKRISDEYRPLSQDINSFDSIVDNHTRRKGFSCIKLLSWSFFVMVLWILLLLVAFDFLRVWYGYPLACLVSCVWWVYILAAPTHGSSNHHSVFSDLPPNGHHEFRAGSLVIIEGRQKRRHFFRNILHSVWIKATSKPLSFFGGLLFWIVLVTVACFGLEGLCIGEQPISVSTRFSRSFQTSLCRGSQPCHVYITMTETPSTSVYVNFQTAHACEPSVVLFDVVSHQNETDLTGYKNRTQGDQWLHTTADFSRGIHYVLLQHLQPDTVYYFRAGCDNGQENTFSEEKRLLTLPAHGDVSFVAGGDMGTTEAAQKINRMVATESPYFAMVGGDLAYANGVPSCYRLWDIWLNYWETQLVNQRHGTLIPMLLAIGNHESGGYSVHDDDIPFFIKWFPQETTTAPAATASVGTAVASSSPVQLPVAPPERKTYHYHLVSNNSMMLVLDSGIYADPAGEQRSWMEDQLQTFSSLPNKMALYHLPLYPLVPREPGSKQPDLLKPWLPLFDTYNLTIGFENHVHSYKKSKVLRGGKENPQGTLYLGDGAWGVMVRYPPSKLPWYIEKGAHKNFVHKVEVKSAQRLMNISAIDTTHTIFDSAVKYF